MRPIAAEGVACSVFLLVIFVSPAKTAEPIEMPFVGWTRVGPRNHLLDGVQISQGEGAMFVSCTAHPNALRCTQHKIDNGISATAKAECIAPACPMSC